MKGYQMPRESFEDRQNRARTANAMLRMVQYGKDIQAAWDALHGDFVSWKQLEEEAEE